MSWHCLQEPGEAFSVERYLAGVALERLRSRTTPAASSCTAKQTESSPASPSGMMCEPLTATHGAALSMSSAADSPVRTYPAPERVQGLQEHEADSGARCTELLARYDHAMHSWKTPQCSLLEGLDAFSETWPKSGMMRRGCAYRLPIAAPRTGGSEFGFSRKPGSVWLGTPTASMTKRSPKFAEGRLPTPMEFARRFPTPTCHDAKLANPAPNKTAQGSPCLTERILEQETSGGQLNPTWVEWLMGWPLGWTDLKPLETDKHQSWRQGLSSPCNESLKG